MKLKTVKIMSSVILSTLALSTTGCQKQKQVTFEIPADGIELNITEFDTSKETDKPLWKNEDHKTIGILFGYGFNEEKDYAPIKEELSKRFGLEEEGGLLWTVTYPDDFKYGRIMNMYDMINEKNNLSGIILLGAPERTHYMLASLQDYWNNSIPYPIFSFFPQDDILGEESTCDFVLEYERDISEEAGNAENAKAFDFDVTELLSSAIQYMDKLDTSISYDKELSLHVQNITGNKSIYRYTDSESGLPSINHFILRKKETN